MKKAIYLLAGLPFEVEPVAKQVQPQAAQGKPSSPTVHVCHFTSLEKMLTPVPPSLDWSSVHCSERDPPTQAEVEGIKAALEKTIVSHKALRDRFEATGGNGLLTDS